LDIPLVVIVPSRLDGLSGIRGAVEEEEATALSNAELRFWFVVEDEGPARAPARAEPFAPEDPFSSHGFGRGGSDDDIGVAGNMSVC
jgi:hypothetical protein